MSLTGQTLFFIMPAAKPFVSLETMDSTRTGRVLVNTAPSNRQTSQFSIEKHALLVET